MIKAKVLSLLFAISLMGLADQALAQPRIGEKIPEFSLQSTTGPFYGIDYSKDQVSVLFYIGYS